MAFAITFYKICCLCNVSRPAVFHQPKRFKPKVGTPLDLFKVTGNGNGIMAGKKILTIVGCVTNEKDTFSFQCCIRDEGRPLIYALQKGYINYFMVL